MFYQKIINFVKYHNAFTIGLLILFIISSAVFANENVRDGVVGKQVKEVKGINNAALLKVNLANFDLAMKIVNIQEDEEKFYVDYTFKTFEIKDNVWQEVAKDQVLTIDKKALDGRDLGVYIAKELGEVADGQLAYLNKAQTQEKEKGQTMALETIDWTGLIGLVMSPKTKELVGYEPASEQEATDLPRVFKGEGSIQPEMFSAGQAAQKLLEIKRQEEQAVPLSNPLPNSLSDVPLPWVGEGEKGLPAEARSGSEDAQAGVDGTNGVEGALPPDVSSDAPSEQLTLPPAE